MIPEQMEQVLGNVDRRVERIEQILPTLATKADLQAAIEPLATRAELRAAIEPLATKAELRAAIEPLATKAEVQAAIEPLATRAELRDTVTQFQAALDKAERRMRTHFDVVTESLRDDIQLLATALANLSRQDH